jgi:phosphoglycolate phosphatase-like HAD superfamily hydrolase
MFDPLLSAWGVRPEDFWDACTRSQRGPDGYDLEHSYLARLTDMGREDPARRLDAAKLNAWGRQVDLYPGLADSSEGPGLFRDLREKLAPGRLECFIISGGLQPVIEGCLQRHGLSPYFKAVFACRMAEEDPGDGLGPRLSFPKETVNFTVKTQKLFSISKGSWMSGAPDVNAKIRPEDLRVPFKNMLYLGDGHSDVAAFALLRQFGGSSFAVHAPGDAGAEAKARGYAVEQARATEWFEADYRAGRPLRQAILNWALGTSGRASQPELALP